jgi:hypothetical protein
MAKLPTDPVAPTQTDRAMQIIAGCPNLFLVLGNVSGHVTLSALAKLAVALGHPAPHSALVRLVHFSL